MRKDIKKHRKEFLKDYKSNLKRLFKDFFVIECVQDEILNLINAIKEKRNIFELLESEYSFTTIFLPFHIGSYISIPNNISFLDLINIDINLKNFFYLSAKIENITSNISANLEEPSIKDKKKLLIYLKLFIKLIPDEKVFNKYVDLLEIRVN